MRLSLLAAVLVCGSTLGFAQQPRVVPVEARDFSFVAPDTINAGTVTFRMRNAGKELHHLWIVRLSAGETPADFRRAMNNWGSALKMPAWATDVGGPNSASPGTASDGTMTLEPGTYM